MLAGLAAQSVATGSTETLWAFATTALVFAGLLITASLAVTKVRRTLFPPIRMVGSAVKRWSGYVLIGVGLWFIVLSTLRSPLIGA